MTIVNFLRKGWIAAVIIGAAVALQGCLDTDNGPDYDPYEYLSKDVEAIQNYLEANNIDAEMDSMTGIFVQYHTKGNGYRTINGVEIEANYQGLTLEGTEFANTFSGTTPRIKLGRDGNPASYTGGLNIGITRMNEGDSATIYVPSPYAFQDAGFQNVPPNTVVMYNVKFEDILLLSEDLAKIDDYIAEKSFASEIDTVYGIRYVIHQNGNPNLPITLGDYVSMDYTGVLLDDTQFDSSVGKSPLQIYLGQQDYRLIIGFEMGLTNLHDKDSASIFIPSIYAYGSTGSGSTIPANAPLVFGLDILNVIQSN